MMYKDTHIQLTDCLHNMEQEQTTLLGGSSIFSVKKRKMQQSNCIVYSTFKSKLKNNWCKKKKT